MEAKLSASIAIIVALTLAPADSASAASALIPGVDGIEQIPAPVAGCEVRGPLDPLNGRNRWTRQERWVWSRICIGKRADFGATLGSIGHLDPRTPLTWPENRILRASFLQQVLREEPYRSILRNKNVTILGARFREPIRIEHLSLGHELGLIGCRFDSDLSLHGSESKSAILLDDSAIAGTLNLRRVQVNVVFARRTVINNVKADGANITADLSFIDAHMPGRFEANAATIGKNLSITGGRVGTLVLNGAKIGNDLDLNGVEATKPLELNGTVVGGDVHLRGSNLPGIVMAGSTTNGDLDLSEAEVQGSVGLKAARIEGSLRARRTHVAAMVLGNAVIGRDLDLTDSSVLDVFAADGISVGRNLDLTNARLPSVQLSDAMIGNNVGASDATVAGTLELDGATIGQHLILRGANIAGSVIAKRTAIDGYLDVSTAQLSELDIEAAQIGGQLRLGWADGGAPSWRNGGKLVLTNARVGELVDRIEAWTPGLEYRMRGFRFGRLGGGKGDPSVNIAARDVEWLAVWLENEQGFSIDAYEQLAVALRTNGRGRAANQILYRVRYGEVRRATGLTKIWKLAEWAIVGFGYRVWRAFAWIALFLGLGTLLYGQTEAGKDEPLAGRLSYSLDLLLPIPVLLEKHGEAALSGFVRYYFHVHRLAGFIIGLFVVAAMGGLIA